jgi:broad specificity phosphatase PhoE
VANDGVPIPGTFYTSPLRRCLETTKIVFSQFEPTFRPVVKELLRESLCDHTCDRRRPKSWIASHYPDYVLEPGFTEEDELWRADYTETPEEHAARKHRVLDEIFATDGNLVVSLTVHSGAISAILKACNFEDFRVREGSTVAVLVEAVEIEWGKS